MQSSNPLFLSYRSLERGFASRLAADLKAASVPLWFDCMDIGLGSSWDDAIAEAIEKCSGLLARDHGRRSRLLRSSASSAMVPLRPRCARC